MAVDYSARYYKLAGVKECLYHPKLPTFRRIDMDTAAHKLPDHHCRTTTPCTRENFNSNSVTIGLRTPKAFKQSYLGRNWDYKNYYSFRFDDKKGEAVEGKDDVLANKENSTLRGNESPSIPSQSLGTERRPWKFSLQQEPHIDHIGQRPIPATVFSRYRSTTSLYGGQVSSRSWRP